MITSQSIIQKLSDSFISIQGKNQKIKEYNFNMLLQTVIILYFDCLNTMAQPLQINDVCDFTKKELFVNDYYLSFCFQSFHLISYQIITDLLLCSQIQMGNNSNTPAIANQRNFHPHLGNIVISQVITQVKTYGDPVSFQDAYHRFQNRIKRLHNHPYLITIKNLKKQQSQQLCSYGGKITLQLQKYHCDINTLFEQRISQRQHFKEADILTFLCKVTKALISIYDSGFRAVHLDGSSILISRLSNILQKSTIWEQADIKIIDSTLSIGHQYYQLLSLFQVNQKRSSIEKQQNNAKKVIEKLYLSPQLLNELKTGNPDPLFTPKCDVFSLGMLTLSMCCLQQLDPYYDYSNSSLDYENLIYRLSRIVYSQSLKKLLAEMLEFDSEQRIGLVSLYERLKIYTRNCQNSQIQRKRSSSSKLLSQMLTVSSSKLFSRQKSMESPAASTSRKSEDFSIDKKSSRKNSIPQKSLVLTSSRKILLKRSDSKSSLYKEKAVTQKQPFSKVLSTINDQTSYLKEIIKNKTNLNSTKTVQSSTSATRQFFDNIAKNNFPSTTNENFKQTSSIIDSKINRMNLPSSEEIKHQQSKKQPLSINKQQVNKCSDVKISTEENPQLKNNQNKQNYGYRNRSNLHSKQNKLYKSKRSQQQTKTFNKILRQQQNRINSKHFGKKKPTLNIQSLEFISPIPSIYPQTNPISQTSEFSSKQGLSYADLGISPEKKSRIQSKFETHENKKLSMKPFQFMQKDLEQNDYAQSYNQPNRALLPNYKETFSIQKSQNSYFLNEQESMNYPETKQYQNKKNFSKLKQNSVLPLQFYQNNKQTTIFRTTQSIRNSTGKKQQISKCLLQSNEKVNSRYEHSVHHEVEDKYHQNYQPQQKFVRINLSNGKWYEGELNQKGVMEGNGILSDQFDRIIYSGSWEKGKFHGFGSFYPAVSHEMDQKPEYKNLSSCLYQKYEGQFKSNQPNGFGTFFYRNGDKFSGCILNGIASGYGCYYFSDGQIISGMWRNNEYIEINVE